MSNFIDYIFGFLPKRAVFWTAFGTSLFIFFMQWLNAKLNELVKLPYMRAENQQKRKELVGQSEQPTANDGSKK
ncbi:hypothetical protein [Desertibacillus haloalkaliphilus]|uniref:hypothetical protein n=1 Tax=Desertibacillus haloalkaliphilus TaxID=1328930 RepID=UPI001C267FE3|nr:hypothetical protein [Desertibacillus haloalkaliphilus]MBU8905467.1 hypothetical protein [Desertibacillus haloalkaliphilus]